VNILNQILERKREEIAQSKRRRSAADLEREISALPHASKGFRRALETSPNNPALIAEVKRASPSRGQILRSFDPVTIAGAYVEGGADCVSVLTDRAFFQGSADDFSAVRNAIGLPMIRKDFIIDEYQILETKLMAADCVLLIVRALECDPHKLRDLFCAVRECDMDCLIETHDEKEMECAIACGADLIGINNRNLHDFEVDLTTTARLSKIAPKEAILVSESGIQSREDAVLLSSWGARAILVGESLETQPDVAAAVQKLIDR
jgi:indole-3-glycerol phosphate synthase